MAVPCNSFGFMSSSQHARSHEEPEGDTRYPFVVHGNLVAARETCMHG